MRAAPRWEMSPAAAEAGQETTLQIVDQEDGPDGRTVCIIPGNLKSPIGGWRVRPASR